MAPIDTWRSARMPVHRRYAPGMRSPVTNRVSTHLGNFLGIEPTGRAIHFETVDAIRVRDGKITDHWGVANLLSVLAQLGVLALPG